MDRNRALDAFKAFTAPYDQQNPRIELKLNHTYRVAALCERIARSIGLADEDVDLAWLIGLLHDLGRFEQVRRFDSYFDSATVGHAQLGAELLFDASRGEPLVREFIESDAHDELIGCAVATHSDLALSNDLDERTRTLCEVLRDADKVDILKVNCIYPVRDIYGIPEEEMQASELSPECIAVFYEHRCIPRPIRKHPADILLGHICFCWELVFDESVQAVREQGYLAQMLSRTWDDPATRDAFAAMREHVKEVLDIPPAD